MPKRCNEFAGPISAWLRPDNTAPFEEMSQRWRTVSSTVSDLTAPTRGAETRGGGGGGMGGYIPPNNLTVIPHYNMTMVYICIPSNHLTLVNLSALDDVWTLFWSSPDLGKKTLEFSVNTFFFESSLEFGGKNSSISRWRPFIFFLFFGFHLNSGKKLQFSV